jgi:NUMOD4 motif
MGVFPDNWNQSMKEEWLPVANYEGYYEVSNLGRVRSLDREVKSRGGALKPVRGKVLQPSIKSNGYASYSLGKEGARKYISGHRLVALHFLKNPLGLPEVNHKDFDRVNNVSTNLEWATAEHNKKHSYDAGHQHAITNPKKAKLLSTKEVDMIYALRNKKLTYLEIANTMGCSASLARQICAGVSRKKHGHTSKVTFKGFRNKELQTT